MSRRLGISLVVLGSLQFIVLCWIALGAPERGEGLSMPGFPTPSALPARPAGEPADPGAIGQALTRLAEQMEAQLARPAPFATKPAGPVRRPATPEWAAALQTTLGELRATLDRLAEPARRPARPPDWGQLAQVRSGLLLNREAERKKLLLTPLREVLDRFGKPNEVHIDKRGRQIWHYQRSQLGDPNATEDVFVAMNEGVVVSVFENW